MKWDLGVVKRLSPSAGYRTPFRLVFLLILMLALGIGSAGQITSVQAAPSGQEIVNLQTTYTLNYHLPNGPFCVGQQYLVPVEVSAQSTGISNGNPVSFQEVLLGVTLEAHSNDQSIVEFDPYNGVTGDPELAFPGAAPSGFDYTLIAKKAGSTSIYFKAGKTSPKFVVTSQATTIKVLNCKYKVATSSSWSFSAPNLFSHLAESAKGEMQLVSGSNDTFKGTADVTWDMTSFSEMCGHKQDVPPAKAQLDGTLNENGTLTVTVTFDPFDMSTQNCASSSYGQFPVPAFKVTVPGEGGPKGGDHSFIVGDAPMHGYTTVIVTPVEGQ